MVLLVLALLGATSLLMKEIPLSLFGVRSAGVVKEVEVIQTSTSSKWENNGFGHQQAVSFGGFTTKAGKPIESKTTAIGSGPNVTALPIIGVCIALMIKLLSRGVRDEFASAMLPACAGSRSHL